MKKYLMLLPMVVLFILNGCGNNHGAAIEASGTLEAVEVSVSAKVPGQIERLCIQEGSRVSKGDTLALLDRSTLELQWKQAKGGVDLAEAQYRLLLNGARIEDVRQAEEAVRQAESAYNNARGDFDRMKELFVRKSVTKKQYDDAESRVTIAQAQFNSVKQNLQRFQRFARPEDLAAAKARLDQARASADLLKKQLTDAAVLAPVGGIVTSKPVEEGELIPAGGIIGTIARLEQLNLMIYVNEADLGKVKLGGSADIVIDTYPDKNFPGRVVYISPIAEFTPKNVQTKEDRTKLVFGVKLTVENPDGILKSGMPADAYLK
jgi:HlyD family secretion protein